MKGALRVHSGSVAPRPAPRKKANDETIRFSMGDDHTLEIHAIFSKNFKIKINK